MTEGFRTLNGLLAEMPGDRLLIVDDNPLELKTLHRSIRLRGVSVDVAPTYEAAMLLVRARPYSVVIVDWCLENERTGGDFVRALRSFSPETRTIIISGHVEIPSLAESVGADLWARKPFEVRALSEKVRALLAAGPRLPAVGHG